MSRDPEMFIHPEIIPQFKEGCKKVGVMTMITSVDRDELAQMALYAQGRRPIDEVNAKRRIAGMLPIKESQNNIVTWTLNSKHIPVIVRLDDKGNPVKKSRAFDFAVLKDGLPIWDIKASVDGDLIPDYLECAIVGEGLGLRSGRTFPKPDYSHLQWQAK